MGPLGAGPILTDTGCKYEWCHYIPKVILILIITMNINFIVFFIPNTPMGFFTSQCYYVSIPGGPKF